MSRRRRPASSAPTISTTRRESATRPVRWRLKQTVGVGASSVSYKDWIGSDLLVFIGSNVANNQPVTTKYLYYAKQQGAKLAVINPYKEPGMVRYWVPSVPDSAVMGTKLMDEFYQVTTGGDIAFLNGTLKYLIEQDWVDHDFIEQHTVGWSELEAALAEQDYATLERSSGVELRGYEALCRDYPRRPHRDSGLEHGRHPAFFRRADGQGHRESGIVAGMAGQGALRRGSDTRA